MKNEQCDKGEYKFSEIYGEIKARLLAAGIEDLSEADFLICEVLKIKRGELLFVKTITDRQYKDIQKLLTERIKHKPLDKIINKKEFYGLEFYVNENVLSPRPETEILAEFAIEHIKENFDINNHCKSVVKDSQAKQYLPAKILDLCTGSGCIAITVAKNTSAEITASDISKKALKIAGQNAKVLGAAINFVYSDMFKSINPELKFDLIISNPPYIKTDNIECLDEEVKKYDPLLALDGGEEGLKFYSIIADNAANYLNEKGVIMLEIGFDQAESVPKLLKKDFKKIKVFKDYSGLDRFVIATKK